MQEKKKVLLGVITEQRVPPFSFQASGGHSFQRHHLFFARRSASRHTTWLCTRCLHSASPRHLPPRRNAGTWLSSSLQTASNIYLLVPFISCQ